MGRVCRLCTVALLLLVCRASSLFGVSFDSAKPVWPKGREEEKNVSVGFRTVLDCEPGRRTILRIAGSSLYRIWLNGEFVGHGPARGPHGYYRVDEWPLEPIKGQVNVLAIEAVGYNVNSFYLLDQPSFVQAEVVCGGKIVASTAGDGAGFEAGILNHRVQKVQRYSFQRPFIEYYRQGPDADRWRADAWVEMEKTECSVQDSKNLLVRRVAYPRFLKRQPATVVSRGTFEQGVKVEKLWKDRSLVNIGPQLKGYRENELEVIPSIVMQRIRSGKKKSLEKAYRPDQYINVDVNEFCILDLGKNLTGFVGAKINCDEATTLYITFDEILSGGDVDFKRLDCVNCIGYELEPGWYDLESIEPYTMRYLKLNVLKGSCRASEIYVREYVNPESDGARFSCSDSRLNRIFEAARETFKQNATDIFMDCPSRERAGWLCDSFFTARVAFDLCGNTTIEKNLFENYSLPKRFEHLPDGMLPMCYPADHYDGVFIPNWALWFVIELEEYWARSGDSDLVEALRPRLEGLYRYFERFKNEDGLLEKLESWVFVEWSKANSFVQDVSYPTNMLYAGALAAMGRMYDEPLIEEAKRLREVIREQSFDGEFFVDNAVREGGKLKATRNRTEVCQYFAFFFDVATPESHGDLWDRLVKKFGPERSKTGAYPEVHPANAFIGNYLRLELLSRYAGPEQIKRDILGFYLKMAEKTGTLWEHMGTQASCNHGFASHVVHSLYRDILGVRRVDTRSKRIEVEIFDVGLDWCEGTIQTPAGPVVLRWQVEGQEAWYSIDAPAGYEVHLGNEAGTSGRVLLRKGQGG